MRFGKYIMNSFIAIIYGGIIILVINLLLFSSISIGAAVNDILYLDILLLSISMIFLYAGYEKWEQNYGGFKRTLDSKGNIDMSLPVATTFEAQLIRKTVEAKNEEMYKKIRSLQDLLDEENDYITKWVHEIKIPISVCELIADRVEDMKGEELSGRVSENLRIELERIKFLVNQVMYTSRASNYYEDLQMGEYNLEKTVRNAVKRNAAFLIAKHINIDIRNVNYTVMTDEKWAAYILDQLINNACKYVDDGGKIEIYGSEDETSVKLFIRDNGIGILPQDINRIFDRGFTGSNGRKVAKSTGMGLYISRKMAKKLNHEIMAVSEPGVYTEFSITFYKLSDYYNPVMG
jgi:Histidine kinase-, DNA gyrase B-, and HSP90-like ATPase.